MNMHKWENSAFENADRDGPRIVRKPNCTEIRNEIYRVVQKTYTLCFVRLNFIKYWPIFKLL